MNCCVVFDADGTLLDTMPALTAVGTDLIAYHYRDCLLRDYKNSARELYLSTVGSSFGDQLEELFPGLERNTKVAYEFAHAHALIYTYATLFDTAVRALDELFDAGATVRVISSSRCWLISRVLRRELGRRKFNLLDVSGREYGTKLEQLRQCQSVDIFIGDVPRDAQVACQAGVDFVGVEHTFDASAFPAGCHVELDVLRAARCVLS